MKYQLKVEPVEAIRFSGFENGNADFDDEGAKPDWLDTALATDRIRPHPMWPDSRLQVVLFPAEGTAPPVLAMADAGDYIIHAENGHLNVVKADAFEQAYEAVEG